MCILAVPEASVAACKCVVDLMDVGGWICFSLFFQDS